jgi:alpha-D-ribose 1-methylphosphonate 5-triphosphate synthase subunit PhnH
MHSELSYDTVFDAQQHFRLLLDSMSRPGKINTFPTIDILPPSGLNQASALTGFALLNADVTYFIAGNNAHDIAGYFLINTGSRQVEIAAADYIFLPEEYGVDSLEEARIGIPTYPEDSATIIAEAARVSEYPHDGAFAITLKGPGVDGEAKIFISGISTEILGFVNEQNAEYPLGIDLIITDRYNHVLCIPRSSKFTYTKHTEITDQIN